MANGIFLGGMASGMETAQKLALQEQQLKQDAALRSRGLDITERGHVDDVRLREKGLTLQERQIKNAESQQFSGEIDKQIASTMKIVGDTIKESIAVGRDPEAVAKAVAPLVESAQRLAARGGRDPAAIAAQVQAALTSPTGTEVGTAKGASEGAEAVAKAKTIAAATGGTDLDLNPLKPREKIEAENALRDDYVKQSQPFITVRDFYSNFQQADNSGAGDITRVFAFMKLQDPNSAVLPGEAANAQNAAGVPEAVRAMYNRMLGGGILSPAAREQLAGQAKKLYDSRVRQHDQTINSFLQIAKRQKLDDKNVVVDLSTAAPPAKKGDTVAERFGPFDVPPPPKGFQIVE